MKQEAFCARHGPQWEALEQCIERAGRDGTGGQETLASFPRLFRQACHQLALARRRGYSQGVIARLERLVLAGHRRLYAPRGDVGRRLGGFLGREFPALVRRQWRLLLVSALLFYGPLLAMIGAVHLEGSLVYTVLEPAQVRQVESMYDPALERRVGREDEADGDFQMFGFYIRNNTSIGFRTFAGGLLAGLGTIFFLVFNGTYIGAIAGHLGAIGYGVPFWSFVAGHSAPELTAIVLSGAAGLKLGAALVMPGRETRSRALRGAAAMGLRLMYGAAALFLVAAFVEAFWSSIAWVAPGVKYGVGLALWGLLGAYLVLAGRPRAA